jgi:hypothetical protein
MTEHPLRSDDVEDEAEPQELADRTEAESESRIQARVARPAESNDAGRRLRGEDDEVPGGAREPGENFDVEDKGDEGVAPDEAGSGKLRWRALAPFVIATDGRSRGERRECSTTLPLLLAAFSRSSSLPAEGSAVSVVDIEPV